MSSPVPAPTRIRFDAFELDAASGELRKAGILLKLQPQPFRVLLLLIERAGQVVTREEIQRCLWTDSTFVDFEHGINFSINQIRGALVDSAENPRYVETIPRRGYRFTGTVKQNPSLAGDTVPRAPRMLSLWRRQVMFGIGGLILVSIILGSYLYWKHTHSLADSSALGLVHRQVTFVGDAHMPAISPDGKFVAYVTGHSGTEQKLMMEALSGGPSLELLHGQLLASPRWSPDGAELSLAAHGVKGQSDGLFVLSRLGGAPRRVAGGGHSCWSPDGSQIITAYQPSEKGIWLINNLTGEERRIPAPGYQRLDDVDWSVKTGMVLLVTWTSGRYQLWVMKPDGSEQRKLIEELDEILSPRWSPGGDAIYYFRPRGDTEDLVKVSTAPKSTESSVLVGGLEAGYYFTLSSDGTQLAYIRTQGHSNLWLAELPAAGATANVHEKPLTSGTLVYGGPNISPDGHWVAFTQSSTKTNIFKMSIDGGQPVQLTLFDDAMSSSPVWSPDGERIAFICDQQGTPKVWVVDAEGGAARPLDKTNASNTNYGLAWFPSPDIVYQQPGLHNLRRLNVDTQEEEPLLLNDSKGWLVSKPIVSPDGKNIAIFWNRSDGVGLWVITVGKNSERFLYPDVLPFGWSSDGKVIYANKRRGREILQIGSGDPKQSRSVITMPGDLYSGTVSPDGREIIGVVGEEKSEVWLMINFDPQANRTK